MILPALIAALIGQTVAIARSPAETPKSVTIAATAVWVIILGLLTNVATHNMLASMISEMVGK